MKRPLRALGIITSYLLWSSTSSAQSLDKDADAERLFREGQRLLEDGRYGEACPKFEAAYRKDHQLGTLLNLAYCHKEQGALWQSWLEFKEAELKASELKRHERRDFARQRMVELEKSLARVVIEPHAGVELTEVLVEDRHVPEAEKAHAFAAEPGQRKLTFRAKGKKPVVQLVTIIKSERPQHIGAPEMVDDAAKDPVVDAPLPPTRPVEGPRPEPVAPSDGTKSPMPTQKTVALVAVGLGVVGLGVGSVFGLQTLSNACTDGQPTQGNAGKPSCTPDERDAASEKGTISTVAFVAGGALVAAGLVLWLTAPSGHSAPRAGGPARRARAGLRIVPELGAGWAGLHGTF
jgi:hypothetical protein